MNKQSLKITKHCRECQTNLNSENTPPSFLERGFTICRKCDQENVKKLLRKKKIDILTKLGNICQCCKNTNPNHMSIDHIHGGGQKDREKRWKQYIQQLHTMPTNELLSKYQCLCFNCNYTKGIWGVCPHNLVKEENWTDSLPISNRGIKNTHLSKEEHKERELILRKIETLQSRLEALKAYGNTCVGCGETHPLFLTLDHIQNNVNHDDGGKDFYNKLRRLGYPGKGTQLQIMCHNCNAEKEYVGVRVNKNAVLTTPNDYISQPYYISDKDLAELNKQARQLYHQMQVAKQKTSQNLAGIQALNASVLDESISESLE